MKIWATETYGEKAEFKLRQGERSSPNSGEIEIAVKATSLNPVDNKLLRNSTVWNPDLPGILHGDVSGTVTAVGEDVTEFSIGDDVYGCAGGVGQLKGALVEYMIADKRLVAHMPSNLSYIEAAALPLVTITAWEGLKLRARMTAGSNILIHAGAGGVGHIALQLAKAWGAHVSTTVSTEEKADIAKSLGADEIIFYKDEPVENYVKRLAPKGGFDIVFDTVGGLSLEHSLLAAKRGGQVVGTVGSHTHDLTPMHLKGLSLHIVMMLLPMFTGFGREVHGHILREAAKLVESNKLRPLLDPNRFSFNQINEAHAYYETGQAIGKISLENT